RMRPPTAESVAYPRDREAEIVLRDGSTVHVRPIRPEDEDAVKAFLDGVSSESIGFRFFGMPNIEWVARWSGDVDYVDRFALVAESGTPRRIVAHAAYVRIGAEPREGSGVSPKVEREPRAEVAFLVADAWQSRGISTILLAHLVEIAQGHGIVTF